MSGTDVTGTGTTRGSSRIPLGREIAEDLRRRIVGGEFPPGARLPSETDLAAAYRVSRVTIRTAAKALESQGLVDIRHGSGMFVVDFADPSEFKNLIDHRNDRRDGPSWVSTTRSHAALDPATNQPGFTSTVAQTFELQRAITADGEVVAYSYDVLPAGDMTTEVEKSRRLHVRVHGSDRFCLRQGSRSCTPSIRPTSLAMTVHNGLYLLRPVH